MPPEEVNQLVALWMESQDGPAVWSGVRLFPKLKRRLKISWYTAKGNQPEGYDSILDGVIFADKESLGRTVKVDEFNLKPKDGKFQWRDSATKDGFMLALALAPGQTLARWSPNLQEAKDFGERVAAFWLLFPSEESSSVSAEWSLSAFDGPLDGEIDRLTRSISLARQRKYPGDYDIALSFAGEDREYVEQVAQALVARGVRVFYDKFEQANLFGKNLYTHLSDVYQKKARFTLMFISRAYAAKNWTNFEREAAQARAFAENREYILPVRIDDVDVPGMLPTVAYVNAAEYPPSNLAALVVKKLESGIS